MNKRNRFKPELVFIFIGLVAAFFAPTWAVDMAADKGFSGAVVFTNGLKNLGLGDMGRGIGMCGLIGLFAALVVTLAVYVLLLWLRRRVR